MTSHVQVGDVVSICYNSNPRRIRCTWRGKRFAYRGPSLWIGVNGAWRVWK